MCILYSLPLIYTPFMHPQNGNSVELFEAIPYVNRLSKTNKLIHFGIETRKCGQI
jgi:hypothetical protein